MRPLRSGAGGTRLPQEGRSTRGRPVPAVVARTAAMAKTRRRKRRTQQPESEGGASAAAVPRSFVLKRGRLAPLVAELTDDMRKARSRRCAARALRAARADAQPGAAAAQVMEPHTAKNLKDRKTNKLKDFIHVAGPLGAPARRATRAHAPHSRAARAQHRP